jgi:hypothetical protein
MGRKQAITIEQQIALRRWAYQQHPRPTQKQAGDWFFQQFNHRISQSTVLESLLKQYDNLDNLPARTALSKLKQKQSLWPELERVLLKWQRRIKRQGGSTSRELLIAKARQIWNQLPCYNGLAMPAFSNG